jgi:hypothetical protein
VLSDGTLVDIYRPVSNVPLHPPDIEVRRDDLCVPFMMCKYVSNALQSGGL